MKTEIESEGCMFVVAQPSTGQKMLPIPKTCEYATLRGERNFTDVINNTDSEECVCWGGVVLS